MAQAAERERSRDAAFGMKKILPPGSVVGILGGGQLGRMLGIAAAELGLRCHVFAPEKDPPTAQTANKHTRADYNNIDALKKFVSGVDVLTYEFENIPVKPVREAAKLCPLRPSLKSLQTTQDRKSEKEFVQELGLSTAVFASVAKGMGWKQFLENIRFPLIIKKRRLSYKDIEFPAIVKTRQWGYDGKGQVLVHRLEGVDDAYASIGRVPAIAEKAVDFSMECSVVLARGMDGETRCFDVIATYHEEGILRRAVCPAPMHPTLQQRAQKDAIEIAKALGHVGVLTVEFFLVGDSNDENAELLVNEIAPRVHNSGHWTREACITSQFEQHIRAICGWPLGDVTRHSDAEMINLLGDDANEWKTHAGEENTSLHLYGKGEARPGRKMGHVVRIHPRADTTRQD